MEYYNGWIQDVKLTIPAVIPAHITRFHNAINRTSKSILWLKLDTKVATIWPHSKRWGRNEYCNELLVTQKKSGLQQENKPFQ